MKKAFSFILILLLLSGACAYAANTASLISPTLEEFSYTSDDGVYREYTAYDIQPITMNVGEYFIVMPIHFAQSWMVSYSNLSAVSSNPDVVSATPYTADKGRISDGISLATAGTREYLGVKLYAKDSGSATITLKFYTYMTSEASKEYIDNRGVDDGFTRTIHVTVNPQAQNNLRVSLEILGEDSQFQQFASAFPVKNILFSMKKMKDVIDPTTIRDELIRSYMSTIIGSEIENYVDLLGGGDAKFDLLDLFISRTESGILSAAQQAHDRISVMQYILDLLSGSAEPLARFAALNYPTYTPQNISLKLTVENMGETSAEDVYLVVNTGGHMSFSTSKGPWRDARYISFGSIEPGEGNAVTRTFSLYPMLTYGAPTGSPVWTDTITVSGTYDDAESGQTINVEGVSISVQAYSDFTSAELMRLSEDIRNVEYNNGYYKRFFGVESYDDLFTNYVYIACPVEVVVLDTEGNEVAAIGTDEGEMFNSGGLIVGAAGDSKFIMTLPSFSGEYEVRIRALDDGTMQVFSGRNRDLDGTNLSLWEDVELKTGESFAVDLDQVNTAGLSRNFSDGFVEVEPTAQRNPETVLQAVAVANGSEWAKDALTRAILNKYFMLPEDNNLQRAMTWEEFARLLSNIYCDYFGIDSVDDMIEECGGFSSEDALPVSALSAVAKLQLIPESYIETEKSESRADEFILLGEAASIIYNNFLPKLKNAPHEELEAQVNSETALEELVKMGLITDSYAGGMDGSKPITLEEGVAFSMEIVDYVRMYAEQEYFVRAYADGFPQRTTSYQMPWSWASKPGEVHGLATIRIEEKPVRDEFYRTHSVCYPQVIDGAYNISSFLAEQEIHIHYSGGVWEDPDGDYEKAEEHYAQYNADGYSLDIEIFDPQLVQEYGNTRYYCLPFIINSNSEEAEDIVALCISVERDVEYYESTRGINFEETIDDPGEVGERCQELIVVTDKDAVAYYLDLIRPILNVPYDFSDDEAEAIIEEFTSKGSVESNVDVVAYSQGILRNFGYLDDRVDGVYGKNTAAAVRAFQESAGLEPTGNLDNETLLRIMEMQYDQPRLRLLDWLDEHPADGTYDVEQYAPRAVEIDGVWRMDSITGENYPDGIYSLILAFKEETPAALYIGGLSQPIDSIEKIDEQFLISSGDVLYTVAVNYTLGDVSVHVDADNFDADITLVRDDETAVPEELSRASFDGTWSNIIFRFCYAEEPSIDSMSLYIEDGIPIKLIINDVELPIDDYKETDFGGFSFSSEGVVYNCWHELDEYNTPIINFSLGDKELGNFESVGLVRTDDMGTGFVAEEEFFSNFTLEDILGNWKINTISTYQEEDDSYLEEGLELEPEEFNCSIDSDEIVFTLFGESKVCTGYEEILNDYDFEISAAFDDGSGDFYLNVDVNLNDASPDIWAILTWNDQKFMVHNLER